MKVFISWSGEPSKQIARLLYEWLPIVLQNVEPYMSSEELEKGTRWSSDIAAQLEATNFGLICLVAQNISAPWVHFEAGALAKVVQHSKVAPILFGLKPSDVQGPLTQFQLTAFEHDDMRKLLATINSVSENPLDDTRLDKAFRAFWNDLEENVAKILSRKPEQKQGDRPDSATILEELLVLVRQQSQALASSDLTKQLAIQVATILEESRSVRRPIDYAHPVWSSLFASWKSLFEKLKPADAQSTDWESVRVNAADVDHALSYIRDRIFQGQWSARVRRYKSVGDLLPSNKDLQAQNAIDE